MKILALLLSLIALAVSLFTLSRLLNREAAGREAGSGLVTALRKRGLVNSSFKTNPDNVGPSPGQLQDHRMIYSNWFRNYGPEIWSGNKPDNPER